MIPSRSNVRSIHCTYLFASHPAHVPIQPAKYPCPPPHGPLVPMGRSPHGIIAYLCSCPSKVPRIIGPFARLQHPGSTASCNDKSVTCLTAHIQQPRGSDGWIRGMDGRSEKEQTAATRTFQAGVCHTSFSATPGARGSAAGRMVASGGMQS